MKKPELDIPELGWVPSHVQVFRLKLPCTGVVSAEVRVQLTINITAVNPKHGDVSLVFRRNKICLKTTDMLLDSLMGNTLLLTILWRAKIQNFQNSLIKNPIKYVISLN